MAIKRGGGKKKAKSKATKASKELLLENFVLLQKTLVETVAVLKQVDNKISSLLNLFEEASKSFKEGRASGVSGRLAVIEEQNKVIAKTLLLLQKQLKEKEKYGITRTIKEPMMESLLKPKKKKKKKEPEEAEEESLFKEEFGTGEETEEPEESEEYRPKPLPEFSF